MTVVRYNLNEKITELADNEIKDKCEKSSLMLLLQSDTELRYEYDVQVHIKNLLRSRFQNTKVPTYLQIIIQHSLRQT